MGEEHALFTEATATALLLMAFGAFVIPLACRPFRLPAAVGEILFGILVGPYVLGWVEVSDFIQLIAQLGFFLLMFIAGLELDFTQIEKGGLKPLGRALLSTVLILAFSFVLAISMGYHWFVGMVLGAISIGIPLVLLHETGLGKQPYGQTLLLIGSVGEFTVILLATGISAYAAVGGLNGAFALELFKLVGVFALAYLVLVVLRALVWWHSERFSRIVDYHDTSEIGVRAGLALMFVFVALASFLHIDPILGAFISGALFSFAFRAKGPLELKFMSIGNGFFIPFFFISVGLGFDLNAALQGDSKLFWQLLLALPLVRLLAFILTRPKDQTMMHAATGSLLLSAPLTLLVVIANLGLSLRLVDTPFHATVIMLAVVSSALYPWVFKVALRQLQKFEVSK